MMQELEEFLPVRQGELLGGIFLFFLCFMLPLSVGLGSSGTLAYVSCPILSFLAL
jgi:hypothetical protein